MRLSTRLWKAADHIFIRNLKLRTTCGLDAWNRHEPQPVHVTIKLPWAKIARCAATEDLQFSLDYDTISRNISGEITESTTFNNVFQLAESIKSIVQGIAGKSQVVQVAIDQPKAQTLISNVQYSLGEGAPQLHIQGLLTNTIIGIHDLERNRKQRLVSNIALQGPVDILAQYPLLVLQCHEDAEQSHFHTLEAFAQHMAAKVLGRGFDKVTITVEKPSAVTFADATGVSITRRKHQEATKHLVQSEISPESSIVAYIAFGSNQGNSCQIIKQAMTELHKRHVFVTKTSSMYTSKPMYAACEQRDFVNGVFQVLTHLSPVQLLKACKEIEYDVFGRVKHKDNEPRPLDLDIVLYGNQIIQSESLVVPHRDMLNRSFVLKPLTDIAGGNTVNPETGHTLGYHWNEFRAIPEAQESSELGWAIPSASKTLSVDPQSSVIMGILNVTPDSFSDDGQTQGQKVLQKALQLVNEGAQVLDVGGMSTHPSAKPISEQEELDRVLPVLEQLKGAKRLSATVISLDTYRANVAKHALEAGYVDWINDVSGGTMDPDMLPLVKDTQAPFVLNHIRGTPQTMASRTSYKDVIQEIGFEMAQSLSRLIQLGIPRWQVILDPGFGFAKDTAQCLRLIRDFGKLKSHPDLQGCCWLAGPSRKGFIGQVTDEPVPNQRVMGTAAAVTALRLGGVQMFRVHDVSAMRKVLMLTDRIACSS